jgi:hypothetical protein
MLADLIILALIIAFVSVATLGHILLGIALLTRRADRHAFAGDLPAQASLATPSNAANDGALARDKLAA